MSELPYLPIYSGSYTKGSTGIFTLESSEQLFAPFTCLNITADAKGNLLTGWSAYVSRMPLYDNHFWIMLIDQQLTADGFNQLQDLGVTSCRMAFVKCGLPFSLYKTGWTNYYDPFLLPSSTAETIGMPLLVSDYSDQSVLTAAEDLADVLTYDDLIAAIKEDENEHGGNEE